MFDGKSFRDVEVFAAMSNVRLIWDQLWVWIDWHGRIATLLTILLIAIGGTALTNRALAIWSPVSGVYLWVITILVFAVFLCGLVIAGSKLEPIPKATDTTESHDRGLDKQTTQSSLGRPDTFRQEILDICEGVRANSQLYIFLKMRLVSTVDASVFSSFLHVEDDSGNLHKATRVTALAGWELEEDFFDKRFNMDNIRRIPIETIALQTDIFRAGITNNGWICFEMDGNGDGKLIRLENIVAMTIEIEDGLRSTHKLHFPDKISWPIKGKVVHQSLRRLA
jgi:hypothetical protein